jgi:hypothetical protein
MRDERERERGESLNSVCAVCCWQKAKGERGRQVALSLKSAARHDTHRPVLSRRSLF